LGKLLVIQCVELRLAGRNVLELVRASKKRQRLSPKSSQDTLMPHQCTLPRGNESLNITG